MNSNPYSDIMNNAMTQIAGDSQSLSAYQDKGGLQTQSPVPTSSLNLGASQPQNGGNILNTVDQGLQQLKLSFINKGVAPFEIQNYFGDPTNARLNYITKNMQGDDQKAAMQALVSQTAPGDPLYHSVVDLAKMFGVV